MCEENICFEKHISNMGRFWLRPLQIPDDIPRVQSWVSREYAKYWGMVGYSVSEVEQAYLETCEHADVFLGFFDDEPAFLVEAYPPENDPVGEHYEVLAGDRGMHILVAPAERRIPNFTWTVFTVVMDFIFSDPTVKRVVVEPDVRNDKIHALNKRAGFEYQKIIPMPDKSAYLAFCTRAQYQAARSADRGNLPGLLGASPDGVTKHLQPNRWSRINRLHLRKAISEFAHELLIEPELIETQGDWKSYRLPADRPGTEYRFRAQLLSLDHWHIDSDSIEKLVDGHSAPLDSLSFFIEFRERLNMDPAMLPTYLEEIASTLYGNAYKHARPGLSATELAHADFQDVETAMLEGHPVFVANNGRIGFDAIDYHTYAPETGAPVKLIWLAAHKSKAEFACSEDLSYQSLLARELGEETLEAFARKLGSEGLAMEDYYLMPVHPWQWFNKLATVFSADIANRNLICLGYGKDVYRPQQSIRTFFNQSHPEKCYVKTALSILNMGFMRGLSPYYMRTTPAINDWISSLIEQDPYLAEKGFSILREVAAIGYRNAYFENAIVEDSPYKKMLSSLWRESPIPKIRPGQRLITMASLLHVDAEGRALLPEIIRSSGLDIDRWLKSYLDCYLSPLLHCFYAHDLVFMPHGENLILVMENHVPVRAIMKDIAEETAIMNEDVVLSEKVQRLSVHVPEVLKVLSLFTDVFDCIFRFVAPILLEHNDYSEQRFWQQVADCVTAYQTAHPELSDKFQRYDLFAPEFARSCLNRLQLGNNQQMIDLQDPAKNLKFAGTLNNPIAALRPEVRRFDLENVC
ncbi:GNAT family N-acetyltransferase [Methylohalobius crimeensis]|uniref:GNAT family N-acetyltransferase n=1 Tax=Methylohalobius crimeensis TaxID=244365 RepID=UPI0003B38B61|nr:GNAT family N-acetyltransferase [Methylohalobius crimeensis]